MDQVFAYTDVLVFKAPYGRIRISKTCRAGIHLLELLKDHTLDCDDEFIYLNNENDFMGHRLNAIVNMCIYIRKRLGLLYMSVVDLQPADPYKQCNIPVETKLCPNDCDFGFRSIRGSRAICNKRNLHPKCAKTVSTDAPLSSTSSNTNAQVGNKRPRKRSLSKSIPPPAALPVSE